MLVGVFLPAGVVAVVGDVALALPGLKFSQVQPGVIVLQGKTNITTAKLLPLQAVSGRYSSATCSQGWLSDLSTLKRFLIFTCSRLLIKSVAAENAVVLVNTLALLAVESRSLQFNCFPLTKCLPLCLCFTLFGLQTV